MLPFQLLYLLLSLSDFQNRCSASEISNNKLFKDTIVLSNPDSIDNWKLIQSSIDTLLKKNGGVIILKKGKYVIRDKSILIWGSNIKIIGEKDSTIIEKTGKSGWWGDNFVISGKIFNGKYYGSFGKSDYSKFEMYTGPNVPANNIYIQNIIFSSSGSELKRNSNNIGVFNSSNVFFSNCTMANAPQTNVAVINDTEKHKNGEINFYKCKFVNSGRHNFRAISFNQGPNVGNNILIENSSFFNVNGSDTLNEISGLKVHLWYRAGLGGHDVRLKILNCHFDSTGIVYANVNVSNLEIKGSSFESSILLKPIPIYRRQKVRLKSNSFYNRNCIQANDNLKLVTRRNNFLLK